MEKFEQIIITYWPTIIEYVLMIVSYFLVFLYRSKTKNTNTNLRLHVKDTVNSINATEQKLREDAETKLAESKANYDAAISQIINLKEQLNRQEQAIKALLGGINEETGTNTDDETTNAR